MISKFKNNEARKSALIYRSNFEQVQELYEDDKEMAGELAISILEMALTGEISSDDKMIRLMLKNFEVSAESNKQKYEAKERNAKEEKAKTYKLYEIAEMLNEGKTQTEIATALGVSRQTISRRLNEMIRVEYPELLCSNGEMSNDVKQCKNNVNVNVNVNDNVNDNDNVKEREEERGAATPPASAEISEIQKNQMIDFSEIQKNAENAEIEETKTKEEPRRLEETSISHLNKDNPNVIGEIDNEKDLIAYLEILFGGQLTSKVKSQLQVALKTMSAKQIARFYFYCDQKEHRKFLRGSEMTLGLLQFDDIKERANTYWTNLDNRRKQFTKDYNSWQLDQKEIIVKIPQKKPTKRRAYTKEEIEAMV